MIKLTIKGQTQEIWVNPKFLTVILPKEDGSSEIDIADQTVGISVNESAEQILEMLRPQ